ncbi:MAG TPA: hypothetical protein VLL97_01695, partial [Acidobacteriota bacterium]|nr:hypothetical protein [Acidobacteriota bacterium]
MRRQISRSFSKYLGLRQKQAAGGACSGANPGGIHTQEFPGTGRFNTILGSSNLQHSYFPLKGLPFSLIAHSLLAAALLSSNVPRFFRDSVGEDSIRLMAVIDLTGTNETMYLPFLGGSAGSSGKPDPPEGGRAGVMTAPAVKIETAGPESAAPAPKKEHVPPPEAETTSSLPEGLSYPGRQEILSLHPDPDNYFETLLLPELAAPPELTTPLLLPNIVQIAGAEPDFVPETDAVPAAPAKPEPLRPPDPAEPQAQPYTAEKPSAPDPELLKPPDPSLQLPVLTVGGLELPSIDALTLPLRRENELLAELPRTTLAPPAPPPPEIVKKLAAPEKPPPPASPKAAAELKPAPEISRAETAKKEADTPPESLKKKTETAA